MLIFGGVSIPYSSFEVRNIFHFHSVKKPEKKATKKIPAARWNEVKVLLTSQSPAQVGPTVQAE